MKNKDITVSDERCPNCNRHYQIREGELYCFYCHHIASEDERLREEAIEMIRERKKKEAQRLFDNESLINDRLKNASFENYETSHPEFQRAKAICQRYAENFNKENPVDLLLIGSYGTGKSHLAVAIVKYLVDKKVNALFISVPKLLTKIKDTYNRNSAVSEMQLLNIIEKVDCLVLDDIGAEKSNATDGVSWAVSKLFEIIDSRAGKHTIYTTNFEPDQLQKGLGPRNFSRMMDGVHPIKMYGEDFRLRQFKRTEE